MSQQKNSKHKIYSLYQPQVHCIAKGKRHKKYEFCNKVSILYTQTARVIIGAMAFGNPYNEQTLNDALRQYQKLKGKSHRNIYGDRDYKEKLKIGETDIHITKPFSRNLRASQRQKRKKGHRTRAAIEPTIGHFQQDLRSSRNFLKGVFDDTINVLLLAAVFNFKRMINKYKEKYKNKHARIEYIQIYRMNISFVDWKPF